MDIGALAINMSNASLASAVQLSVMKLGMNANEQMASQINEMMSDYAFEPGKGMNIDSRV